MSLVLLLLLGAVVGFAATDLFNGDGSEFDPPDGGGDDDTAGDAGEDQVTLVSDGLQATGTDGQDVYLMDPMAGSSVSAQIDAGAGDDIIDLATLFDSSILVGSQLDGGEGNDAISAVGESLTVSGGAGNDTITIEALASTVSGGDGDDDIRALSVSGDATTVDGGAGNDTLDGTGSDNIDLQGGAGDDVILTSGSLPVGTGFTIGADGGEGNDTLTHEVEIFPLPLQEPVFVGATMTGGAGADSFEIVLTSGNGSFSASPDDPAVFVNEAAVITDFEQGVDELTIDLTEFTSSYTAESGTLTEDTANGTTELLLRLTSDNLPDQDLRIVVGATGLTWADVSFVGDAPTTLAVA